LETKEHQRYSQHHKVKFPNHNDYQDPTKRDQTWDPHVALPAVNLGHEHGLVNQCLGIALHANKKSQTPPKLTKFQ
jgi:hypothetical protein